MKKLILLFVIIFAIQLNAQWDNSIIYPQSITKEDTTHIMNADSISNVVDTKGYQIGSFRFDSTLTATSLIVQHSNDGVVWTSLYDEDKVSVWTYNITSVTQAIEFRLQPSNSFIQKRYVRFVVNSAVSGNKQITYSYTLYNLK